MSGIKSELTKWKTRGEIHLPTTEDWEAALRNLILDVKRKNDRIVELLILVIILQGAFLMLVADHALI